MNHVVDTRFFIEHYYSTDTKTLQKTSKKMKELIETGKGIVPTIVIAETIQLVCSREGKQKAEMVFLSITTSKMKIENLTPPVAKQAGILKSTYKYVPMGDCIIAATAIENQARIISDDPHYDAIKETKRAWL